MVHPAKRQCTGYFCLSLSVFNSLQTSKRLATPTLKKRVRVSLEHTNFLLIPVLGKLFEKLINKRLIDFMDKTTKIDKNQFGFQKKSSTDTALVQVVHNINKYLDQGEYVLVLFIDLRKAFDLVDHSTLLEILEELGCRGLVLKLLTSYLSNRKVSTCLQGMTSDLLTLQDGVPQGSVLGPTLYLLYINSLRYLQTKGMQTIYADDTCFIYHSKNSQSLESGVKSDINLYLKWLQGSRLVMNVAKTNYIIFRSSRKPDINVNITVNNKKINRVQSTKYLGVCLDEKLNWSEHIENVRKKIDPLIGAVRRCPKFNNDTRQLVFNGHFLSKLRPNLLIWSICNREIINKAQVLINRALKAIYRLDWFTSQNELIEITNTYSLDQLILLER